MRIVHPWLSTCVQYMWYCTTKWLHTLVFMFDSPKIDWGSEQVPPQLELCHDERTFQRTNLKYGVWNSGTSLLTMKHDLIPTNSMGSTENALIDHSLLFARSAWTRPVWSSSIGAHLLNINIVGAFHVCKDIFHHIFHNYWKNRNISKRLLTMIN